MPKDALDIIDTAVKIGLGAIISGVATYVITHKSHSHEKEKQLTEKKISVLEFSVENIEPYIHALQSYLSRIDGMLKHGYVAGSISNEIREESHLLEVDTDLLLTREKAFIATSRLRLIGMTEVVDTLDELIEFESALRKLIIFEKELPTEDVYKDIVRIFTDSSQKFYESINRAFEKTYS